MSFFQQARFFTTAGDWASLPPDQGLEIAFAGRSNAGKSSAINLLTNQSRLAYTSKTPGRTQHINFFELGEQRFLVDLPGYGYAQVPLAVKRHWQQFLSDYLVSRQSLKGLVLLMDIRHPLTDLDTQLLQWYLPRGKPLVILLTKSDKLARGPRLNALRAVKQALQPLSGDVPMEVIAFSNLSREGLETAQSAIQALFSPPAPAPAESLP